MFNKDYTLEDYERFFKIHYTPEGKFHSFVHLASKTYRTDEKMVHTNAAFSSDESIRENAANMDIDAYTNKCTPKRASYEKGVYLYHFLNPHAHTWHHHK